jgi:hypothetical protein
MTPFAVWRVARMMPRHCTGASCFDPAFTILYPGRSGCRRGITAIFEVMISK